MVDSDRMEEMALAIIASAGEAKGLAYNAVNQAKEGDFAGAEESLKEVERAEHSAHDAHHDLLQSRRRPLTNHHRKAGAILLSGCVSKVFV